MLRRGIRQRLRDHLFAPERHDKDRSDVRVTAVGRERIVGHPHVGPELTAACQVRQRGAERRHSRGNPLRHDRRADDGRDDEHVIPGPHAAVGSAISEESGPGRHRSRAASGSAGRRVGRIEIPAATAARQVVRVHVRAGANVPGGETDRAAVLDDGLPSGNRLERDFMAGRNRLERFDGPPASLDAAARLERFERGGDIVAVADDDHGSH